MACWENTQTTCKSLGQRLVVYKLFPRADYSARKPIVRSMKLLGVTIDKNLNFTDHVADIVRRISNQIQVMQRHKKLINSDTETKYTMPICCHIYIIAVSCGTVPVNVI